MGHDMAHSVIASDVTRFGELLEDDSLCSLPDGSLVGRGAFLEHVTEEFLRLGWPSLGSLLDGPQRRLETVRGGYRGSHDDER